jgi:hypothetical protein
MTYSSTTCTFFGIDFITLPERSLWLFARNMHYSNSMFLFSNKIPLRKKYTGVFHIMKASAFKLPILVTVYSRIYSINNVVASKVADIGT